MEKIIKHYVGIYGSFGQIAEIEADDIKSIKIPKNAEAISVYDKVLVDVEYNGKIITLSSNHLSSKIFRIGIFRSPTYIKYHCGENSTLYYNIISNNWLGVVNSPNGNITPVYDEEEKSLIIDPSRINKDGYIDAPEHKTEGANPTLNDGTNPTHKNNGEGKQ